MKKKGKNSEFIDESEIFKEYYAGDPDDDDTYLYSSEIESVQDGSYRGYYQGYYEDKLDRKSHFFARKEVIAGIIIVLLLFLCGIFSYKFILNPLTFMKGTTINAIDVSGLNEKQAAKKIEDEINKGTFTVVKEHDEIETIKGFKFHFDSEKEIKKCLHPDVLGSFARFFSKKKRQYKISLTPTNEDKTFNDGFKKLSIVKHAKCTVKTEDAKVDLSTHEFKIVPEVYGDDLDKEKLKADMLKSIGSNDMQFVYDKADYKKEPKIKKDSKEIQKKVKYYKSYLGQKVTLNTCKGPYTIPPKKMKKFILMDEKGKRTIKKKKLKEYVDKLYEKFSVGGDSYDLDLIGGHVSVSGGNYGCFVDKEAEYKQLKRDFESNEDVERNILYLNGMDPSNRNDIGDTYVEIDISKQKLWFVRNGKICVSCNVVTGNVSDGHGTPTGVYMIAYKESPATLQGENADGSEYESKVTYWMPFNGGIGCHDASWRKVFGGNIYRTSGSHGCVNMPRNGARKLYNNVEAGVPVVVHD